MQPNEEPSLTGNLHFFFAAVQQHTRLQSDLWPAVLQCYNTPSVEGLTLDLRGVQCQ